MWQEGRKILAVKNFENFARVLLKNLFVRKVERAHF